MLATLAVRDCGRGDLPPPRVPRGRRARCARRRTRASSSRSPRSRATRRPVPQAMDSALRKGGGSAGPAPPERPAARRRARRASLGAQDGRGAGAPGAVRRAPSVGPGVAGAVAAPSLAGAAEPSRRRIASGRQPRPEAARRPPGGGGPRRGGDCGRPRRRVGARGRGRDGEEGAAGLGPPHARPVESADGVLTISSSTVSHFQQVTC